MNQPSSVREDPQSVPQVLTSDNSVARPTMSGKRTFSVQRGIRLPELGQMGPSMLGKRGRKSTDR